MPITKTSGSMVVQDGSPSVFATPIAHGVLCIAIGIAIGIASFLSPSSGDASFQFSFVFFAIAAILITFPRRKKITIDKKTEQITFESFSPLGFRSPFSAPRTIQTAQVSKIVQLGESQTFTPNVRGGVTIDDIEPERFDLCFVLKNGAEFRERLGLSQKESAQIAEFLHVPLEKFVS